MKLEQAYKKLQWGRPLMHERAALQEDVYRGIGTSAHMLIELYLDMVASQTSEFARPEFLVLATTRQQASYLREWLLRVDEALDLDVDIDRVSFFPMNMSLDRLRARTWFSWAIFCDHAVKEHRETDRNVGPYGLIRRLDPFHKVVRQKPTWRSYDRDGKFLGVLTEAGKRDLMDTATCPITLGGKFPTTYPASPVLNEVADIRLRKAFER